MFRQTDLPKRSTSRALHARGRLDSRYTLNMIESNPQFRNVGNLGDILKHAALVSLAKIAINRTKKKMAYIDTHAFLLSAPCTNAEQWHATMTAEYKALESPYKDYFMAERQIMDNLSYRCSAGLILDLLNASGISYKAYLGESDPQTRAKLTQQLGDEKQEYCEILSEAEVLSTIKLPDDIDTVLMLVDPFVLDDGLWKAVSSSLR